MQLQAWMQSKFVNAIKNYIFMTKIWRELTMIFSSLKALKNWHIFENSTILMQNCINLHLQLWPTPWLILLYNYKGVAREGPGDPGFPQSKCCFRFLGWILAEICLKCIILVTVRWFDQLYFLSWLWRNWTPKNELWRHFCDVIGIMSQNDVTKITSQNFFILGSPSQSKFLATPVYNY